MERQNSRISTGSNNAGLIANNGSGRNVITQRSSRRMTPTVQIDADSLARMVKDGQLSVLESVGGALELARRIGCVNTDNGLTRKFNFEEQRNKFGKNSIDLAPLPSYLSMILEGAQDVTIIMLTCAAIVSLILALGFERDKPTAWIEGTAILITIFIVLNVQAMTEYSKTRSFRKQQLEIENAKSVTLIRDGENIVCHPREVVVGDIMRIALGDVIAADGVLLDGFSIKMDEAALTGESKLMVKVPFIPGSAHLQSSKDKHEAANEATPFILSGTNVVDGNGRMLVVAVGVNSVSGKILAVVNRTSDNIVTKAEANAAAAVKPKEVQPEESNGASIEVSLPTSTTPEAVAAEQEEDTSKAKSSGRCSICRFKRAEAGGTLMEKLDILAINIGKVGLTVALLVFAFLIIRWAVEEFAYGGKCTTPSAATNQTQCALYSSNGCVFQSGSCQRVFDGTHDVEDILQFFITAITILVVAVPEGLPLAVTLSLAISMKKMLKDNNQVKHLDSCETMGSATTICSDKTGTLTENRMTVMRVAFGPKHNYAHDMQNNRSVGAVIKSSCGDEKNSTSFMHPGMVELLSEAMCLNSMPSSNAVEITPGTWKYTGNATECALLKLSSQLGYTPESLRRNPVYSPQSDAERDPTVKLDWGIYCYPFSSSRKRASYVVKCPATGGYRLFTKGAPNIILDSCVTMLDPVTLQPKGISLAAMEEICDAYQDSAMRTLAIGYRDFDVIPEGGWETPGLETQDITLIGVVGIEDPLRPTVVKAIEQCNAAGVDVRMCTGDALPTAIAISKQCHILRPFDLDAKGNPKQDFAMTGAEFDERVHLLDTTKPKVLRRFWNSTTGKVTDAMAHPFMLDEHDEKVINQFAFDSIWPKLRVLARCQPEDKLALVRGLRSSKVFTNPKYCDYLLDKHNIDIFPDFQVVAVTGDGTNDAPALKSADVGFAMGIVGTEIAKQACDIVLLDDNFASIVKAVKWGRNVFDSIAKFIQFQLTINITAITLATIGSIVYGKSPLAAVQMLWINLIMDSFASIALATEPPTEHLLQRKPYGKRRPMVSRVMMANMLGHAVLQLVVMFCILFLPTSWIPGNVPQFPPPGQEASGLPASVHWTMIFNTFVWMQLSNQINSRKLPTVKRLQSDPWEWCVFTGLLDNPYFFVMWIIEAVLQVIIVQYGGAAFTVADGGLSGAQWGVCIGIGLLSFAWQFVIYGMLVLTAPLFQIRDTKTLRKQQAKWNMEVNPEFESYYKELDSVGATKLAAVQPKKEISIRGFAARPETISPANTPEIPTLQPSIDMELGLLTEAEARRAQARKNWKIVRMYIVYGTAFLYPLGKYQRAPAGSGAQSATSRRSKFSREASLEDNFEEMLRGGHNKDRQYRNSKAEALLQEARVAEIGKAYLSGEIDIILPSSGGSNEEATTSTNAKSNRGGDEEPSTVLDEEEGII